MSIEAELFGSGRVRRGRCDAFPIDRRSQTDYLQYRDGDDVDTIGSCGCETTLRRSWPARDCSRGVEPTPVAALSERPQPVEFPPGNTLFDPSGAR
jgi:hypothetical protein